MISRITFFFLGLLVITYNAQGQEGETSVDEIAQITSQLGPKATGEARPGWRKRGEQDGYTPPGEQYPSTGIPSTYPTTPTDGYPTDEEGYPSPTDTDGEQPPTDQMPPSGQVPPGVAPFKPAPPPPPHALPGKIPEERIPIPQKIPQAPPPIRPQKEEVPEEEPEQKAPEITPPTPPEKLEEELVGKEAQELYMEPGNYLRKAKALSKAQKGYELLHTLLGSLEDTEKQLVEQRFMLDNTVQGFYSTVGFNQGQLQERINQLLEDLSQGQQLDNELSEEERSIQQELNQQITLLKKVQDDINVLGKLLLDLDKGLVEVTDQIAQVRDYEARAWKNYQTIDALRNDKEAMTLADEISAGANSFVANTEEIQKWLQGGFSDSYTQTIATIQQQMQSIQNNLADLDRQGVQLAQRTTAAEKEEAARRAAEEEKARKEKEAAEKLAQQKKGIFNRIKNAFTGLLTFIKNFVQRISSALFGWMAKK